MYFVINTVLFGDFPSLTIENEFPDCYNKFTINNTKVLPVISNICGRICYTVSVRFHQSRNSQKGVIKMEKSELQKLKFLV
jgi:hypothetical protein